ncbi:hypothetical protein MTO96_049513 [Rhipicephalus appendiculatus]
MHHVSRNNLLTIPTQCIYLFSLTPYVQRLTARVSFPPQNEERPDEKTRTPERPLLLFSNGASLSPPENTSSPLQEREDRTGSKRTVPPAAARSGR